MAATATTGRLASARAQARYARMSAFKARAVLDLIRGLPIDRAAEVLRFTERGAATDISKVLASAIANATHNDGLDDSTLYVSVCYADEGPTLKRWRPRARGRATRIRKRTCHITIIVSTMSGDMLAKAEADRSSTSSQGGFARRGRAARDARRARVARSRGEEVEETTDDLDADEVDEPTIDDEALDESVDLEDDDTDDGDDADEKPATKKAAAKKTATKKAAAKKATAKKAAAKKTAAKKAAAKKNDENEDED
jgi:large subunit ribosomal protein L22